MSGRTNTLALCDNLTLILKSEERRAREEKRNLKWQRHHQHPAVRTCFVLCSANCLSLWEFCNEEKKPRHLKRTANHEQRGKKSLLDHHVTRVMKTRVTAKESSSSSSSKPNELHKIGGYDDGIRRLKLTCVSGFVLDSTNQIVT